MPQNNKVRRRASQPHEGPTTGASARGTCGPTRLPPVTQCLASQGPNKRHPTHRGLTAQVHSGSLQTRIRIRALMVAHRFRVIRTIDIAVACFPERSFKAALTAAQRAMRGMVKNELLRRYRTDRFQTIYGLTGKGVAWLSEHGVDATASVRRVSDMSNPEHRLWAQYLTLCCEARGLKAYTEQELLLVLSKATVDGQDAFQGLLSVAIQTSRGKKALELRPDAVAIEPDGLGLTHFEVDRSVRGAHRAASLKALVLAIGRNTRLGERLRRVIVLTRTPRIEHRVLATLNALVTESGGYALCEGRRVLVPCGPAAYTVICTSEEVLSDGRTQLVDAPVGHVIVQPLPVWLPKVRLDGRDGHSCAGWFPENYLPYRRLPSMNAWPQPTSPLLSCA